MLRRPLLILSLLVLATSASPTARAGQPTTNPGQAKKVNVHGTYKVTIRGVCDGTGTAKITPGMVKITAEVKAADGTTGTLVTKPLHWQADHFSGTGTCLGKQITITGRIDQIKNARVAATFTTSEGHAGRIVGTLDGPPTDNPLGDDE